MSLSARELALATLAYGRGQSDVASELDRATLSADTVRGDWLRAFSERFVGRPRFAWTGEWQEDGTYSRRVIGDVVLPTEDANALVRAFDEWRTTQRS